MALFGSYQKRDSASVGASNQDWNVERLARSSIRATAACVPTTRQRPRTKRRCSTTCPPAIRWSCYPNNSDYCFSEIERERVNGQAGAAVPAGGFVHRHRGTSCSRRTRTTKCVRRRATGSTGRSRSVDFDNSERGGHPVFLQETLSAPKDIAWGQQLRSTKDELQSIGLNLRWDITDSFGAGVRRSYVRSKSDPNGPNGQTSYDFGTGAAAVAAHSLDLTTGFPIQRYTYEDTFDTSVSRPITGNNNGIIDIADVSSSVGRTSLQSQKHEIDEFRLEARLHVQRIEEVRGGVDYRTSSMTQRRLVTAQILGDWGVTRPGDIEGEAAGALEAYCLSCLYDDFSPGLGATAFRGNAAELYNAVSPYYLGLGGHDIQTWNNDHNIVDEDITSVYAEFAWNGELGGRKASLVAGVRYEETDVTAVIAARGARWHHLDRGQRLRFGIPGGTVLPLPTRQATTICCRTSTSRSSCWTTSSPVLRGARPLRAPTTDTVRVRVRRYAAAGNRARRHRHRRQRQPRARATGVDQHRHLARGVLRRGQLHLDRVLQQGCGEFHRYGPDHANLFDLRDPSSGAAGTRSGPASATLAAIPGALRNDVNMFVMTAMIDNPAAFPEPTAASWPIRPTVC